ncbi:MAG: bifunctional UDP-N-acetylmuramoyl-tripeptide:D-alanyl-D-alanine ligase/alanine racemase [Bacteroidetes bacterium]|nr:bifunctional UDP-N-acetylmuramoyl-tripeptide:D-alanyl-D-alanine ligase/alanine racemase [Bacteroidota bacterium]
MSTNKDYFSLAEIAKICKTDVTGNQLNNPVIFDLLTDSRNITSIDNCLFFALISKRNDGHKYIPELYQKGMRSFVISILPDDINDYPEASFILVKDTLKALQTITANHRKLFNIPVIGITGSNGKTIVKEWLYQLLSDDKKIVKNPKSYNSQIGVPLSVWQMKAEHELAIFEAGISEPDEMDKLQAIIQPTIGIFTNIGHAHDENFIHKEQKIAEKLKLFTKVSALIYCADYLEIKERILKSESLRNIPFFTWSKKNTANLSIQQIDKNTKKSTITAIYNTEKLSIEIPFTDDASIENAIHCWVVLLYLNYSNEFIEQRMRLLHPIAMRLELKEGVNNCSVINDSYSSDIDSLSIAIDFLNQQKQHLKKTVILSDILQSGREDKHLYSEIADLLEKKNVNRLIGIGHAISKQAQLFNLEKSFYQSTDEFLKDFLYSNFNNETILVKGARIFEFEKINQVLQQKAHETVLEINLNAIIHNLNYYRSRLNPGTKLMAMVKAFSYGSGSFEIANTLQFHHVDYLAVAYADEGVELRKAGITLPIMVMNPEEQSFDTIIKYKLEPEIYSLRVFSLLEEIIKLHLAGSQQVINIHIKLDTGMHRLGFEHKDLAELTERIKNNPQIQVQSVFSHLSASEDSQYDDFTHQQINLLTSMCKTIEDGLGYKVIRHILNSAGIIRFPEAQFEMVRLGIGLYGIASVGIEQKELENVGTLKTIISQIKHIPKNDTIGYSRKWIAKEDMNIAIIPIGYADGLNRKLGNGKGKVLINNMFVPIIGNICMDMCMVDISGIDAKENDEVIIFGEKYPVTYLAEEIDTIPYEILTTISRRVKRIFYQE